MPIVKVDHIDPPLCRANPDDLVVFGDNLVGRGKGGQAIIRDEPNAVGIPTKIYPSWREDAFFTNADLDRFKEAATPRFVRLRQHLEAGGHVFWPSNGIGTGRAQLESRAPRIWTCLQRAVERLEIIACQASTVLPRSCD